MFDLAHLQKVLICEDEALILMDIEATLLEARVGKVISAVTVEEGLALIDSQPPDAAVLDLHLGQDGWSYELAHRLQARGIPFVFSSGTVDIAEGFQSVPLVTKPFSSAQLIAALLQVTTAVAAVAAQ